MASSLYDHYQRTTGHESLGFWPQTIQPPPGLTPCISESVALTEPWDIAILQQLALMELRDTSARKNALLLRDHLDYIERLKYVNGCLRVVTVQEAAPQEAAPQEAAPQGAAPLLLQTWKMKSDDDATCQRASGSPRSDRDTAASSADGGGDDDEIVVIADSDGEGEKPKRAQTRRQTTAILRNIPSDWTRKKLATLLDGLGLRCSYDFLHLPANINTGVSLGYAFVNMCSVEAAQQLHTCLQGFGAWGVASSRVCEVNWVTGRHGLQACVERYRNSHLMHESVPDGYKPAVFMNGTRVNFPRRKGPLRAPTFSAKRSA